MKNSSLIVLKSVPVFRHFFLIWNLPHFLEGSWKISHSQTSWSLWLQQLPPPLSSILWFWNLWHLDCQHLLSKQQQSGALGVCYSKKARCSYPLSARHHSVFCVSLLSLTQCALLWFCAIPTFGSMVSRVVNSSRYTASPFDCTHA